MPLTDDRSKTSCPGPTSGCANPHGDSTVVGLPSLVSRARLPGRASVNDQLGRNAEPGAPA